MNTQCKWIIDQYILQNTYHERLDVVLERNNIPYVVEQYIPFQRTPENIPFDGENCPVIVYGSVEFVNSYCNNIYMNSPYTPGCYYTPETFKSSYYMSILFPHFIHDIDQNYFMNDNCVFVPYNMFRHNYDHYYDLFDTGKLFIRPDSGSKSFSGTTIQFIDTDHELNSMNQLSGVMDHEWILVSSCKNPVDEYRYFIVNGEVVSSTQYMHNGEVYMNSSTDKDCDALAEIVATCEKQIDIAYVCDIAKLDDESCKIVEFNSICSSGFYSANIDSIVTSLSECAEKEFNGDIVKEPF